MCDNCKNHSGNTGPQMLYPSPLASHDHRASQEYDASAHSNSLTHDPRSFLQRRGPDEITATLITRIELLARRLDEAIDRISELERTSRTRKAAR